MSEKSLAGLQISVRGIVQGVGFRPFVFNLAESLRLTGWVNNTSAGVEMELNGAPEALQRFLTTLQTAPPPLARIDEISSRPIPPNGFTRFEIRASKALEGAFLPVSPDVAICADCRRELLDPADRRYRYPFINCTHCGPRFSIIQDIPYDRPNTTMRGFALCPNCQAEYENPRDRRFHAQPVACAACGPQLWYEEGGQRRTEREDALQKARQAIVDGKIVAVKGLGGYHLACDATNSQAVAELRRRKKRSDKPFALMAYSLDAIREAAQVSDAEAALLTSRQSPVVLLERLPDSPIAEEVAPGQRTLGFMLPYTPLHLLLMEPAAGFPHALVMTSANLSEEPIAYEDADALRRLAPLADAFLLHDRPIYMRVDDSVMRVMADQPTLLRRARGFAPDSLPLLLDVPPLLAAGGELKNTFCLARDRYAFLSHHIGDLENLETLRSFEEGITHYQRLFRVQPQLLACDLHPNYLSSRYARARSQAEGLPLVEVQHHHAHLAACLADNAYPADQPVIGLTLDGTGYGTDGAIWGGEVLIGSYAGYERRFHLAYTPQPGGDSATRKPARMALAHLWQAGLDWDADYPCGESLCYEERSVLKIQLERKLNSPLTSSMGRLFDAAAALLGVRQAVTYEGQAAIELEALAEPAEQGYYPFEMQGDTFNPAPVWSALLADWRAGLPLPTLSARFHNSVAQVMLRCCQQIRAERGMQTVALSGGVWQNQFLFTRTLQLLHAENFQTLIHRHTPPNDGCVALGQALVAVYQNSGNS